MNLSKKIILVVIFSPFLFNFCSPSLQNNSNNNLFNLENKQKNITKWKNATIHLECATDSISFEEQQKTFLKI